MSEELGPCPLCGCEGGMIGETYRAAYCLNNACEMFNASVPVGVWYRLSALSTDAKLGRMVRRLPMAGFVARYENGWHCNTGDVECEGADTPEEALERAMGEGK